MANLDVRAGASIKSAQSTPAVKSISFYFKKNQNYLNMPEGPTCRVSYKVDGQEYFIFADADYLEKWKQDKTIPIVEVVQCKWKRSHIKKPAML